MTLFRTVKYCFKAVSNISMKDLSVDKLSVPNVSVVQKDVLLHIFPGSGANYQGTRNVIFNQWPRPWCSYTSDGHILECLGGEGRGTLSVWVEFQAPLY